MAERLKYAIAGIVVIIVAYAVGMVLMFQNRDFMPTAAKVVIESIMLAISGYGLYVNRTRINKFMFCIVSIYFVADLVINYQTIVGMCLFLISHIIMGVAFFLEKRPEKKQFAVTAVLAAIFIILLVWLWGGLGSMGVPCVIYGAVMILMVTMSLGMRRDYIIGALMFMVSDILLLIYFVYDQLWLDAVVLFLYYFAVCILALSTWCSTEKCVQSSSL